MALCSLNRSVLRCSVLRNVVNGQRRLSIVQTEQKSKENSVVEIQGWIKKLHHKGAISFVHLSTDAAAPTVQVVVPRNVYDAKRQMESTSVVGSAVRVSGNWVDSLGSKQDREILATSLTVITPGGASSIQPVRGDFRTIRESPHLRSRNPAFASVLQARSRLNFATHRFFQDREFYQIDTPLMSMNDCEGAGETFVVNSTTDSDYFGSNPVYLPVSAQLHLEAIAIALPKVYTLSPAFRAEKSKSRHHTAEFRMLEVECAFVESLDEICDVAESYVKEMIRLAQTEWSENTHRLSELMDISKEERDNWAECFDLLCPGVGELAGGSVREWDLKRLRENLRTDNTMSGLDWYFELRESGYARSSGFGIGMERLTQYLFGIPNIKDTIPFPRCFEGMVKLKHRYLLVEVVFGATGNSSTSCSDTQIFHSIMNKVALLHGDYGWAAVRSSFQVKVCDAGMCVAILRVAAGAVDTITSTLPFVLSVGSSDAVLRLLHEGSSMRTVEKHLIAHNLRVMYAQLRRNPTPVEKSALRKAISRVTGTNVAHLRL
ncbi:Ribonuclease P [Aphelenchoides besseyi]|nr:Ribonuclease P [Aphelenchoides besseyi]